MHGSTDGIGQVDFTTSESGIMLQDMDQGCRKPVVYGLIRRVPSESSAVGFQVALERVKCLAMQSIRSGVYSDFTS